MISRIGIEIEYMIVDRDTLDVRLNETGLGNGLAIILNAGPARGPALRARGPPRSRLLSRMGTMAASGAGFPEPMNVEPVPSTSGAGARDAEATLMG